MTVLLDLLLGQSLLGVECLVIEEREILLVEDILGCARLGRLWELKDLRSQEVRSLGFVSLVEGKLMPW